MTPALITFDFAVEYAQNKKRALALAQLLLLDESAIDQRIALLTGFAAGQDARASQPVAPHGFEEEIRLVAEVGLSVAEDRGALQPNVIERIALLFNNPDALRAAHAHLVSDSAMSTPLQPADAPESPAQPETPLAQPQPHERYAMKHLTVRLAWHDNKWNGRICESPRRNVYCVGSHSLLSDRLQRERDLTREEPNAAKPLDVIYPEYVPPCFWSSNAFSTTPAKVAHVHPIQKFSDKRIADTVKPFTAFTWPFRLSFVHTEEKSNRDGKYPADLTERIGKFRRQFSPGGSLVFFYLNYDNPVSADDSRYALVGCARLTEIGQAKEYPFSPPELAKIRAKQEMKNMPAMNWALPVSYDPEQTVILPYHEYLSHIEQNPDQERKLEEMRVLVEEDELVQSFKYVCEPVDDDRALYLLYKLRKAVHVAEGHGIVKSMGNAGKLIDGFIKDAWENRGLYPGVGAAVAVLAEAAADTDPNPETAEQAANLCAALKASSKKSLLEEVFDLLHSSKPAPTRLSKFSKLIALARKGLKAHSESEPLLRKLSLFNLTAFQVRRIVLGESLESEPPVFGSASVDGDEVLQNPYLLCERYTPVTDDGGWRQSEKDVQDRRDGPISPFIIDIGLFPDPEHVEPDEELCDLIPSSPERLRAFIIEHLRHVGDDGDCFAQLDRVLEHLRGEPLFYRRLQEGKLTITSKQLVTPTHRKHYQSRLHLVEKEGEVFFYLREVYEAERQVERLVERLLKMADHKVDLSWIDSHLDDEAEALKARPNFDEKRFRFERRALLEGALKRSLFLVSGKAGSGKTHALRKLIEQIQAAGENVVVLVPTGKAALRVQQEACFKEAQTIDRYLYTVGLGDCLQDMELLLDPPSSKSQEKIQNIIIDESSMVDLQRLATLIQLVQQKGRTSLKRLILIGDENQLPPIGLGRPFYDLVAHIQADPKRADRHIVRLQSDCRQQSDPLVTEVAEIFIGKNRYHSPLLAQLQTTKKLSDWLRVFYWNSPEELTSLVDQQLEQLLRDRGHLTPERTKPQALNLLYGLYDGGYVPSNDPANLEAGAFQIVTPYRAGNFGTLGLNRALRDTYKQGWWPNPYSRSTFSHSDRIIRNVNWYWGYGAKRTLALCNGSIGFVCRNKEGAKYYFPDAERPFKYIDDEESFDLAYAITVHRAQGSEFDNVFVVIPERRALLTRELIYTALTRSSGPVTLFVQKTERENPLDLARGRSAVLPRNSSLFAEPLEGEKAFQPEPGVRVQSKIEYIIYSLLRELKKTKAITDFHYEQPLYVEGLKATIKPDFTVIVDERTYYWEHLGMLDAGRYFEDWQKRKKGYLDSGLGDQLVTTDDLLGVDEARLRKVVDDLVSGKLQKSSGHRFSEHHYQLGT